jgi:hypothetical protein
MRISLKFLGMISAASQDHLKELAAWDELGAQEPAYKIAAKRRKDGAERPYKAKGAGQSIANSRRYTMPSTSPAVPLYGRVMKFTRTKLSATYRRRSFDDRGSRRVRRQR